MATATQQPELNGAGSEEEPSTFFANGVSPRILTFFPTLPASSSLFFNSRFFGTSPIRRLTDPGCPITSFSETHFNPTVVLRLCSAASRSVLSSPFRNFSSPDLLVGSSKTFPISLTA